MAADILVVEDDQFIQDLLAAILANEGYDVRVASNGRRMRQECDHRLPDLILLDLGVPVMILTTRGEIDDRLAALELGADDFVTKPANPKELLLRIRRLLDRSGRDAREKITIAFGPWNLDAASRSLKHAEAGEVDLTRSEFDLMAAFFKAPDTVMDRSRLLDAISRGDAPPYDRTIDVLVSRLRKKLERDPRRPRAIVTVSGVGYKLSSDGLRGSAGGKEQ
jgi:DNA-binding response OmpR family regulator